MKRLISILIVLCTIAVGFFSTGICAESAEVSSTSVSNGVYFIKNTKTNKFVDVKNKSVADGSLVQQWGFHGGNTQKWVISKRVDGYYTIRVYGSATSYYLSVKDDSTANNASIVLKKGTSITDGMLWKVTYMGSKCVLKSKTGEAHSYALSVQNSSSDGSPLKQTSVDDYGKWELIKTTSSSLVPILFPQHNHSDIMVAVGNILSSNSMGYAPIRRRANATKSEFIEAMETASVFFCRTHGEQTAVSVAYGGKLRISDLKALPSGALSNCKLVLYGACLTGKGGTGAYNIVNATEQKGARTVVGFRTNIGCHEANLWSKYFFEYLSHGCIVDYACKMAMTRLVKNGDAVYITNITRYYIAGAKGLKLR